MNNLDFSSDHVHADDLTWREQDVLILLAERLTNREIANHLHLSESTVKDYVGRILSKLYVKNRREAVERAKALGLLEGSRKAKVRPLTNFPAEPTPFVGREGELEEVKRCLQETRLLTLVGPGGIGKTRLALKAAERVIEDYPDGRFFVSLAPIRSVEHIIQTIAEALTFPLATQEDPQQQLLRYLQKRQLLLVIDNFEHLLDGVGIVSEILIFAPKVKILATSRERLKLQSETIYNVGGMAFPDHIRLLDALNYDAIALFVQRASKVSPGFEPSSDELEQIANICQIVQGMPLAIELAVAWLQILSVDEITVELEKGLDILAAGVRDSPKRHRSIRAVFDYSWSLLNQTEQQIFTRLSIFRGGFTRFAAQQVTGASLQLLAGLVNKSFLSHDPKSGRLEIHELLRQYAQERLEKLPDDSFRAHEMHATYYAEFMQKRWQHLKDERQMIALDEIEADIENVRAAWRYYLDQKNTSQIWKFIYSLWHVYWIRWWNHAGMELFEQAVRFLEGGVNEEAVALRGLALAFQGYFMAWVDLAGQGYELAKAGVEILEQLNYPKALTLAYHSLALNAYFLGRHTEEIDAVKKEVELASAMDDKWLLAFTLYAKSLGALLAEDYPEARRSAESNLNLYEEIGDVIGSTTPLIALGQVAFANGEYEKAREFYLRCLNISEETGFYYSTQTASKYLGKVSISLGRLVEAEYYLLQSLAITKEIGFVRDTINLLYEFARLRAAQGNSERAAELLALVLQHPASQQTRMLDGRISDSAEDLLSEFEGKLSQETYKAALKRGQKLELDEVIADLISSKPRK